MMNRVWRKRGRELPGLISEAPPRAHPHLSGCCMNGALIPQAVVLPRPLEHLQVPSLRGAGRTSPRSMDRRTRAPTATPPGARPEWLYSHKPKSHGQPCSRAHCNTARCPPDIVVCTHRHAHDGAVRGFLDIGGRGLHGGSERRVARGSAKAFLGVLCTWLWRQERVVILVFFLS